MTAEEDPDPSFQRIFARKIIPGRGSPIDNGVVIIKNNTIEYIGKPENAPTITQPYVTDMNVNVLMPGLWDCHVHFFGLSKTAIAANPGYSILDLMHLTPPAVAVGRCKHMLENALNSGITSVREVGGFGLHIKQLVAEGTFVGPRIYSAGQTLSITGGHEDVHTYPLCFVKHLCDAGIGGMLCDGVQECLVGVRLNVRAGADVIKVDASGGVVSIGDNVHHAQFSEAELRTIVEEAARTGTVVAAHCHGRAGIESALNTGVHTIEHGTYLDAGLAQRMRNQHAILVPTRWICEKLAQNMSGLSPESKLKMAEVVEQSRHVVQMAMAHDVRIAMGTDMFLDEWTENSKELEYYVNAGMSTLQAIECGTANGPLTLGPSKNIKSGQIRAGFDADLIALNEDPLNDIAILQTPHNIKIVWKAGHVVKNILHQQNTKISSKL